MFLSNILPLKYAISETLFSASIPTYSLANFSLDASSKKFPDPHNVFNNVSPLYNLKNDTTNSFTTGISEQ